MASASQVAANRRNALKSTGPRTSEGKALSRQNATKHGLTAKYAVLPGEDPLAFEALRQDLIGVFNPEGAVEFQLVERSANLLWRLRRVPALELALLERAGDKQAALSIPPAMLMRTQANKPNDLSRLGRIVEALLNADHLGKLSRYEVTLQKQLGQTLKDLRGIQGDRTSRTKLIDAPKA